MNNSPCCEKCYSQILGACDFSRCPCHSNSQEKKKNCVCFVGCKIQKGCQCVVHHPISPDQPSEAWEKELLFDFWFEHGLHSSSAEERDTVIETFSAKLRQKIAEAREEGRNEGIMYEDRAFASGRTAALKECLEVIDERIKPEESLLHGEMDETQYYKSRAHNAALNDLKQQITSLLK